MHYINNFFSSDLLTHSSAFVARSLGFNAQQPAFAMRSPFSNSLGFPEGQLEAFDPLAAAEFDDQALVIAGGLTGPAADEGVVVET